MNELLDRPIWVIALEPGTAPCKKGPFHTKKQVEGLLREAYTLFAGDNCIVIEDFGTMGWYPVSGSEWLDTNCDSAESPADEEDYRRGAQSDFESHVQDLRRARDWA